MDLLSPSEKHTRCPYKGEASYWSVRAGGKVAEDAAWSYPEPIEGAPPLAGYVAFYWNKMDEWLEEDEPAIVHARDPYHRVDVLATSRHVRVSVNGETVAETTRGRWRCSRPACRTRWYFPREDVRLDLLTPSDTRTGCAYKGFASYWSVGDEDDVVWSYPEPRREAERIRDHLAFFNERVDIEVDGELEERPVTQWSRRRRSQAEGELRAGTRSSLGKVAPSSVPSTAHHHLDDAGVELPAGAAAQLGERGALSSPRIPYLRRDVIEWYASQAVMIRAPSGMRVPAIPSG